MAATRYLVQMRRHFAKESDVVYSEDDDEWEEEQVHNSVTGY